MEAQKAASVYKHHESVKKRAKGTKIKEETINKALCLCEFLGLVVFCFEGQAEAIWDASVGARGERGRGTTRKRQSRQEAAETACICSLHGGKGGSMCGGGQSTFQQVSHQFAQTNPSHVFGLVLEVRLTGETCPFCFWPQCPLSSMFFKSHSFHAMKSYHIHFVLEPSVRPLWQVGDVSRLLAFQPQYKAYRGVWGCCECDWRSCFMAFSLLGRMFRPTWQDRAWRIDFPVLHVKKTA